MKIESRKKIVTHQSFTGSKRRSQSNRSSLIYKTCVWLSGITFNTRRNNRQTLKYPNEVADVGDDLILDGENFEQVVSVKDIATQLFHEADFKLYK